MIIKLVEMDTFALEAWWSESSWTSTSQSHWHN